MFNAGQIPFRALLAAGLAAHVGAPRLSAAINGRGIRPIAPPGMVLVPAGSYEPVWRAADGPARIRTAPFWIDIRPVTNAEFLEFVRANPRWRRSRLAALFAEPGYLGNWSGDLALGADAPATAPVVRVSWFAARAYAAWKGKRLPTTSEWERAASAAYPNADGTAEPAYREAFRWFSSATPDPLPGVASGRPNALGVRDMLTLVWEWVDDFNTVAISAGGKSASSLLCAGAAVNAQDLTDYPAFMRAGFRSSLRANYVVPTLGFRCARSISAPAAKSVHR